MKKLSQEEVINRFELKHKDKYDYSLVEYKNQRTKVKIICKEHGIFEMITSLHFSGQGCATLEKFYKNEFINQKYNFKFPANLNFNGKTECFQMEVSNYFIGFQ